MIEIRQAGTDDAAWMQAGFDDSMGWKKAAGYFAGCYQLQEQGELVLLVAVDGENYVGHVKVMWQSAYAHFREQGIPEIQDLAVLPAYRRQAVAKQLVNAAETLIQQRTNRAGIGVGLYADYGPAQRMYTLRGYVPDGNGVTYQDSTVQPGTCVPVDDDLVLYLVRWLGK